MLPASGKSKRGAHLTWRKGQACPNHLWYVLADRLPGKKFYPT
jgi:hypothetical protein